MFRRTVTLFYPPLLLPTITAVCASEWYDACPYYAVLPAVDSVTEMPR